MKKADQKSKPEKCGCSRAWTCAGHTSMEDMGKRVGGKPVYCDPIPVAAPE